MQDINTGQDGKDLRRVAKAIRLSVLNKIIYVLKLIWKISAARWCYWGMPVSFQIPFLAWERLFWSGCRRTAAFTYLEFGGRTRSLLTFIGSSNESGNWLLITHMAPTIYCLGLFRGASIHYNKAHIVLYLHTAGNCCVRCLKKGCQPGFVGSGPTWLKKWSLFNKQDMQTEIPVV